jgi:hypothetical protein
LKREDYVYGEQNKRKVRQNIDNAHTEPERCL